MHADQGNREPSAVLVGASSILAHAPGMVVHGSKPSREVAREPSLIEDISESLRDYEQAIAYSPHQVFIGNRHPRELPARPWFTEGLDNAPRFGPYGEIMPESEFLALLAVCDEFGLVRFDRQFIDRALDDLATHPLAKMLDLDRAAEQRGLKDHPDSSALPLWNAGNVIGYVQAGHDQDVSLSAPVLLENLACKATGVLSLLHLIENTEVDRESVDFVIGCAEEAVGDRYQRGGGNMGKAIAAAAGLTRASGMDVKNFCAGPISAVVTAASLVGAGVFDRVVVVGGGSSPKLGMKFEGHLRASMPILEDVLGGVSVLVERDDQASPTVRLDSVGIHRVKDGGANPQVLTSLVTEPLRKLGRSLVTVDEFATELHNPEITEPQGSGNVPERNYRTLAALAAAEGLIERAAIPAFVEERGMPGFAPTQGHIASAICYLPHAIDRLNAGHARSIQLLAKGSLFLGRMSQLADGMSVLIEQNASES